VRRLLFNLHLYIALVAALFVVILGVTGSIMAFEPEIDHLLHAKAAYVQPQGRPLPLSEIAASVGRAYPGERISGYLLSTAPGLSYEVALRGRQLFVNQYTGQILGIRSGGRDFLSYVHQLHLRLLVNTRFDPGKKIMSWAGVAIVFLALSGVYLWWPYKRVTVKGPPSSRRFWFDLHNAVGICSFAFLLILSITGVMIGFEESTVPMFYKITGSEPVRPQPVPPPPPGTRPISPDEALEIARDAVPGAAPFQINVPGPKGAYQIRARFPEDLTPGGRSMVVIDQYTAAVLFAQGSRTAPAGARVVIQNRAIHTGDIFGIPSKTLMSLVSLALVAQAVSGVLMWWKRSRKKRA
jgi:uncharacterized iron-regulated membrane protein